MALQSPSGSATEYAGPFESFAKEIREGFQKARNKFNEILEKLNSWKIRMALQAAGAALVWYIKSQLEKLLEGLERLAQFVETVIEHHTPIISLMIQSFAWTEKVKGPVSDLWADCTKHASDNMGHWKGGAAKEYDAKALQMQGAIDAMTERSEFMAQWLTTIAKTNVEYVKLLAQIVTFVVGKLVDAAAKAGSVIGLPLLGQTIGDAAGGITEMALNALLQKGVDLIAALGNVRDVEGALNDHRKLQHGAWPQVVRG